MPKGFVRLVAVLAVLALWGALAAMPATAKADHATVVYRLAISGAEEVCDPPNLCGGDGTGEMILTINPKQDRVCFLARWRDVEGTVFAAHIHTGVAGVAGPVLVPLFQPAEFAGDDQTRGCVSGLGFSADINADPASYYVNFHSTVWPAGALRAQLG